MGDTDISAQVQEAKSKKWDDRTLAQKAANLALLLHTEAIRRLKSDERTLLSALSKLTADETNRIFLRNFCAQVLQAPQEQQSDNLRNLITVSGGVPTFFGTMARLRFRAAAMAARSMQKAAMGEVRRIFRSTFGELTLPRSEKARRRIREHSADKLTPAIQPLTPAVFGKKGASKYIEVLTSLCTEHPEIGLVVEPLRLCPSLSPCSPGTGARELADKLTRLLMALPTKGKQAPIILEATNSALLPIIIEGCKRVLSKKAHRQANLILELPAYLNAAPSLLRDLTDWAKGRKKKETPPLKVLLVKGSHLSAERECAFLYGKESGAAPNKAATEARYKQLIHQAISADKNCICPIIGTHNPFDIAYALLDWGRSGREGMPPFIFRAGLGNHLGRLLAAQGSEVIITAGTTEEEQGDLYGFEIYLLELVNELSRPDGYLTHGYAVSESDIGWSRMRQHFLAALSGREEAPSDSEPSAAVPFNAGHLNCTNRAATDAFYAEATAELERSQAPFPLILDGKPAESPLCCIHRSLIAPGLEDYRFVSADYNFVKQIAHGASAAADYNETDEAERRNHILRLARRLNKRRTELAALLVRDAGFTYADAEEELRNAIDAANFYEQSASADGLKDGTMPEPLGTVVVAPGNIHPLADAVGGICAAWIMGNSVIYKPAAYNILLGHRLMEILNDAGMTEPFLRLLPCLDNEIAVKLMTSPRVDGVITSLPNALVEQIAAGRPGIPLCSAPTGISTVYISAQGDWQQAIRDISASAFRRSGQCPTAPHALLVHAEVYDNHLFINALKDAIESQHAAPGNREGATLGGLATLLTAEQQNLLTSEVKNNKELNWLVEPHPMEMGSLIWSPGIITGVKAGSDLLRTIATLPIIALIRVESTTSAANQQKDISAGQAAAIYSPDEGDITLWQRPLHSLAHLCINCCPAARPGLRPFGTARPALRGAAPLPGGPNYLTALANWQETARPQRRGKQRNMPFSPWETLIPKPSPDDSMRLTTAADSLSYWWENEFGISRLLSNHPGEPTELYYSPITVCIRAEKETEDTDLAIALMAGLKAGATLQLSTSTMRPWLPRTLQELGVPARVENREEFENRFPSMAADGITVRDPAASDRAVSVAEACGLRLSRAGIMANGRLELIHYMQEHTITRRTNTKYNPL